MERTTEFSETGESLKKYDWESFISGHKPMDFGELDDAVIEEGCFAQKLSACREVDPLYASIYIRAVKESNKYFSTLRDYIGTEYETNLRPLVRWRKGRPVEMLWARKIVKESPATAREIARFNYVRKSENGIIVRLARRQGQIVCVREIYQYIPRGKSCSYPIRMFAKEPSWVQIEGRRLEGQFLILRKQMILLREIKSRICSIHTLDNQYFEQSFQEVGRTRKDLGSLKDYLNDVPCVEENVIEED